MEADNVILMPKRLKAVLTYDGIDENKMHLHLAKLLDVSSPVAKRMLDGKSRIFWQRSIEIAKALDVGSLWLCFGEFGRYHNRTMRIHVQVYKGYPKAITDKAMRFHFAVIAGQAKALSLLNLISANNLNYVDALEIHQPH